MALSQRLHQKQGQMQNPGQNPELSQRQIQMQNSDPPEPAKRPPKAKKRRLLWRDSVREVA